MACLIGVYLGSEFPMKYKGFEKDRSGESAMFQFCLENYVVDKNLDPKKLFGKILENEEEAWYLINDVLDYYKEKMEKLSGSYDLRFYNHIRSRDSMGFVIQALNNIVLDSSSFISFEKLGESNFIVTKKLASQRTALSAEARLVKTFFASELEWLKAAFDDPANTGNCSVYENHNLLKYLEIAEDKNAFETLGKYRLSVLEGKKLNATDLPKLMNLYMNIAPCPEVIKFLIEKGCRVTSGLFLVQSVWDGDDFWNESNLAAINSDVHLFDSNMFDDADMQLVLMELKKCRTETYALIFEKISPDEFSEEFLDDDRNSYVQDCLKQMNFERVSEVYGAEQHYWKEKMLDEALEENGMGTVVKALNDYDRSLHLDWKTHLYRLDVKKKILEAEF